MCILCAGKNITVKYGETVTLSCRASSNEDVKWTQNDTSSRVWNIYSNGAILEGIRNRFSIKTSIPSQYDLVMERANTADAGYYVCDETNPADGSRTVLSQYLLIVPGTLSLLSDYVNSLTAMLMLLLSFAFTSHASSAMEQQRHQPSEAAADHPPARSVNSC